MARLDFRLSDANKELIARASEVSGVSMSDFVIAAALDKAKKEIESQLTYQATLEDIHALNEAISKDTLPDVVLDTMREMGKAGGSIKVSIKR